MYPTIFVRKHDKMVSTETETDMDVQQYYTYQSQDDDRHSFAPERKQRTFQHLSVPASNRGSGLMTSSLRYRKPTSAMPSSRFQTSSRSISASSVQSEGEDEEVDYDEDGRSEDQEDEEEEGSSESDSEEDGASDPDVEYDEEGEEPSRPHPTNAMDFSNKRPF